MRLPKATVNIHLSCTRREYLALVASFLFLLAEGIIRLITVALRKYYKSYGKVCAKTSDNMLLQHSP